MFLVSGWLLSLNTMVTAQVLPEFHATNTNRHTGAVRQEAAVAAATNPIPYKAIVYFFFDGAADSFNMLVPLDGCDGGGGGGGVSHAQYTEVRGAVALSASELLPLDAAGSDQPCDTFGLHPELATLQVKNTRLGCKHSWKCFVVSCHDNYPATLAPTAHNGHLLDLARVDLRIT